MVESVIQLKCDCNVSFFFETVLLFTSKSNRIQNYPWGKKGSDSASARYCAQTPGTDFKIDENAEYAEVSIHYS